MFRSFVNLCRFGVAIACVCIGTVATAQQISVVPLSASAAGSNYAVSPQADGVTFVGDVENENQFLVVIDGDAANASLLTIGPDGALLLPGLLAHSLSQIR